MTRRTPSPMLLRDSEFWSRITAHAADATRVAYVDLTSRRSITYRDLIEHSEHRADEPRADGGVILPSENVIEFAPMFFGALLSGRCVLPISHDAPATEVARLQREIAEIGDEAAPSLLLVTSGTTGAPKIVRRTLQSLDAVAAAMVDAIGFFASDRVVAAVPLVHSYGLEHGLLAPLWAGATVMLCDGLDLPPLLAALAAGATILPAVPSAIELLTKIASSLDAPGLRRVYTAGAPLPPAVAAAFERRFGIGVGQVYGSTEIGSVVYRNPQRDAPASVGRAMKNVSIRILSTDDSRCPLPPESDGEIAIRSPSMLADYVDQPAVLIDGHFPTGDLGRVSSDGELTLTGRLRLLIDVGGAKVNPLEVERVFESHPAVAACVVLPLRLSETVNKIRAIIVSRDPLHRPSAATLRDHARRQLAGYKVPRVIEFRDDLPRTAAGKIARQELDASECQA